MPSLELGRILADLARIEKAFVLTDGKLGDRLLKAATDGVMETIESERAPDGTPWDELSPGYAAWKAREAPGKPKGHLYEVMADPNEVAGTPHVQDDLASVLYGKTEEAQDEAEYFQEGTRDGTQPPRPFFDFTPDSLEVIGSILDRRFDEATK